MAGEASFTLSEADYLAANRDLSLRSALGRGGLRLALWTVAACAVVGAATAFGGRADANQFFSTVLVWALLGLGATAVTLETVTALSPHPGESRARLPRCDHPLRSG